jgi:hypothetical protein
MSDPISTANLFTASSIVSAPQPPIISNCMTVSRIDYNTSPQTIASGTLTAVQFPINLDASNYPAPTSTSTTYAAPLSGKYLVTYSLVFTNTTGIGVVQAYIKLSNASIAYGFSQCSSFEASALTAGPPVSAITLGTDNIPLTGSAVVPLGLSTTFQVIVYQNSGSSQTLVTSGTQAPLITIDYLHP